MSAARQASVSTMIEALEPRKLFSTYAQTNLVSDGFVSAAHTDVNLKNPWGIAFSASEPFWISDNGSGKTSVFDASGDTELTVSIPGGGGGTAGPTGQVANTSSGFVISKAGQSAPATFIFAGVDGAITGWSENVDPSNAVIAADNSAASAVYTGLAIGTLKHKPILYTADFHNGVVAMYDGNFHHMKQHSAFSDPDLPAGYAPFNVQNLGEGIIGVTFAKVGSDGRDAKGRNHGIVDLFSTNGVLLRRMARGNELNSPWGITFAPADFGQFSNDLLVGMLGSGRVAAFQPKTGKFLGYINDSTNLPIANPGLWAITFGNDGSAGSSDTLFFTAGLNNEADGLFGKIDLVS